MTASVAALVGCSAGPSVHQVSLGNGFAASAAPATIAGACRAVERGGQVAQGDHELAAYGYEQGICGPGSYAAALWGGYPAQR